MLRKWRPGAQRAAWSVKDGRKLRMGIGPSYRRDRPPPTKTTVIKLSLKRTDGTLSLRLGQRVKVPGFRLSRWTRYSVFEPLSTAAVGTLSEP